MKPQPVTEQYLIPGYDSERTYGVGAYRWSALTEKGKNIIRAAIEANEGDIKPKNFRNFAYMIYADHSVDRVRIGGRQKKRIGEFYDCPRCGRAHPRCVSCDDGQGVNDEYDVDLD